MTTLLKAYKGLPFDFEEAKSTNILISGTNKTGKSRLACNLASILEDSYWQVVAFDNSGTWKDISDIPLMVEVNEKHLLRRVPFPVNASLLYDMSTLEPDQQKMFVENIMRVLWQLRVETEPQTWLMIVLEEFQLYGRYTRGSLSQHLLRVMSVGRNQKMRILGITVDLALIDPAFIRLCGQRYHAKLGIEVGSKRRFSGYYGKHWTEQAEKLKVGEFIYLLGDELRLIKVPLFEPETRPVPYKRKGFWATLLGR